MINNNLVYTSHLGVYALIIKDNKILLIKKNRGPYIGLLDLPGGSLEKHESLEQALNREIKEETNCDIIAFKQLESFTSFFNYKKNDQAYCLRHIAILYKVEIEGKVKYDPDGEDSDGCIWVDLNNINYDSISPLVKNVMNII